MDTKSTTTNILSSRIDPKKTAELVARLRKCTLRKGFADDLAYVAREYLERKAEKDEREKAEGKQPDIEQNTRADLLAFDEYMAAQRAELEANGDGAATVNNEGDEDLRGSDEKEEHPDHETDYEKSINEVRDEEKPNLGPPEKEDE